MQLCENSDAEQTKVQLHARGVQHCVTLNGLSDLCCKIFGWPADHCGWALGVLGEVLMLNCLEHSEGLVFVCS